jgi:hypothetical protein
MPFALLFVSCCQISRCNASAIFVSEVNEGAVTPPVLIGDDGKTSEVPDTKGVDEVPEIGLNTFAIIPPPALAREEEGGGEVEARIGASSSSPSSSSSSSLST